MFQQPVYECQFDINDEDIWQGLSTNYNAAHILSNHYRDKIHWENYCKNKSDYAIYDLIENVDNLKNIWMLSKNESMIPYLEANPKLICYTYLSGNRNGMHLVKQNLCNVRWDYLSSNTHDEAIELLRKHDKKVNWRLLSANSNSHAVDWLLENQDKINWDFLNANTNKKALSLLEQNRDKINMYFLCTNKNAIYLIEEYFHKIDWPELCFNENAISIIEANMDMVLEMEWLAENPNAIHLLFTLNTEAMKTSNKDFREELCKYVFEPARLQRYADNVSMDLTDYIELF